METRRASSKVLTAVPLQFPFADQIPCVKGHSLVCVTCINPANPTWGFQASSSRATFSRGYLGKPLSRWISRSVKTARLTPPLHRFFAFSFEQDYLSGRKSLKTLLIQSISLFIGAFRGTFTPLLKPLRLPLNSLIFRETLPCPMVHFCGFLILAHFLVCPRHH